MKICPNCGFRDNPQWRNSRFDFNAEYMRFDEALMDSHLRNICQKLLDKRNFEPIEANGYVYYRRGKGGLFLYRVPKEDFKIRRERKKHVLTVGGQKS